MIKRNKFLTTVTVMLGMFSYAQQTNSLLSNIGLGTQFSEATVAERATGGMSVVNNNLENSISIANPSLLSQLKLTSFGVELQSLNGSVTQENSSYTSSASSISNLFIGIPLGKYGAIAGGLRSFSAVGFQVNSETSFLEAEGGVNQVYGSYGVEVYKGLSIGAQLSYYFGRTDRLRATKEQLSIVDNEIYNVSGSSAKFGLDYKHKINEKLEGYIGTYTQLENTITATGTKQFFEAVQRFENDFFGRNPDDVITSNISGTYTAPVKNVIGLGVGQNEKWFLGLSYTTQGAKSYTGSAFEQTLEGDIGVGFEDSSEYKLGGYFIPKKYSIKNYLQRITYRYGAVYKNTGLTLNNNSVKDIGMTFGLGMPVGKRASQLNFSLELGRLGDSSKNKYQEEYLNLGLSFTLADKWFKKRVID